MGANLVSCVVFRCPERLVVEREEMHLQKRRVRLVCPAVSSKERNEARSPLRNFCGYRYAASVSPRRVASRHPANCRTPPGLFGVVVLNTELSP
jgi:hypothetical protein